LFTTTGMITSFSLPGFPSLFNLRIPPPLSAPAVCDTARELNIAEVTPNADTMEANRALKLLRLNTEFTRIPPLI
jgi:hypothetical protein